MSSASSQSSPKETERRTHTRRRMEGLAYVDLGPDNGAILIDLGEGGLGFHSVAPVTLEQAVLVKFKLPKAGGSIESYAEVVWLNESGKGGGLRFVELKSELREQIGMWAEAETTGVEAGNNAAEVENASVESETIVAAEPVLAPTDLTAEPVSDGASAAISEDVADIDRGAIATQETGTDAVPAIKPGEEQAISAARAATLGGAPTAGKPSRPAGNAPAKVHPSAGVSSDGISSRVHSGIVAASASESAPASRVAPPTHSAAASGGPLVKQMSSSPSASSVSGQTRDRGMATQPRTPVAVSNDKGGEGIAPFGLQPQVTARRRDKWQAQGEELLPNTEKTPAFQALKIGIGAAAGAILVLAIVAGVPSLRTRVLATSNAKSTATPLEAVMHEFQVEVADVNNRRWILKSGGGAGSPFADASSHHNAQPAAAPARKNAGKSDQPNEPDEAIEAPTPPIQPQPKTANPAELVLAHPLKNAAPGSQEENLPPSIFDGITPPIGSLADNSPVAGPNVPGPAPVQAGIPGGNLQAAVLLKRVAPIYPAEALKDDVKGEVRVKATIGKDGVPTNLTAVSGDPRLVQAALDAIRQWRYRPATLEGQAIETTTTVSVAFQAN